MKPKDERQQKARVMMERVVEAQRLLDPLAESPSGNRETVAEALAVSGRLLDEAWEMADELFPSGKQVSVAELCDAAEQPVEDKHALPNLKKAALLWGETHASRKRCREASSIYCRGFSRWNSR